jgi:hypothetical protein
LAKLEMMFANLTEDNEDWITLNAFEKHMNERRMKAYFHSLDIKVSDAWTLFKLLDQDHAHAIDLDQFVEGCLQLKGPATAINIKTLETEFHWFAEHIDRKFSALEINQAHLKSYITHAKPDINTVQFNDKCDCNETSTAVASMNSTSNLMIPGFIGHEIEML